MITVGWVSPVVYETPIPAVLRWLGARWRDGERAYRMTWGELSFQSGCALELCLFGGDRPHFSLHVHLFWVSLYISLPFLNRWAWEPHEIMEGWGFSYHGGQMGLHLRWGRHTKVAEMPWHDWVHLSHEVRRPDGSWVPYVGSWEHEKEPDGRETWEYPYRYLLKSGEKQEVTATVHVERRTWCLRALRRTRFRKVRYSIDVEFSDEVGEGRGSWKGGTVGCGYELLPGETALQCLRRMEQERRFPR